MSLSTVCVSNDETVSQPAAGSTAARFASYRFSYERFKAIRAAWKAAARAKTTTASQHAVYALLRGASLEKAFSPIQGANKIISNGNNPNYARDSAVFRATRLNCEAFAPWADLLKDQPRARGGWAYEGTCDLFEAVIAEAEKQAKG